jgi:PiT family inorganic phosphate transporter
MTLIGLPISSTQATVGAIIGGSLLTTGGVNIQPLMKIFLSWVLTPLGGLIAAYIPYKIATLYPGTLLGRFATRDGAIRIGLILVTCYGAYSLGANNVANVTGVYVESGLLTPFYASLFGSAAIALGIMTFSKKVIRTVGSGLVPLDPFAALAVILAQSITLNVYALLGVPVSASQAVVGAVIGIGLVKGPCTPPRSVRLAGNPDDRLCPLCRAHTACAGDHAMTRERPGFLPAFVIVCSVLFVLTCLRALPELRRGAQQGHGKGCN